MSEILINMSGYGQFRLALDLTDPAQDDNTEVWRATFCDDSSDDCQVVYFEMGEDYEVWDLVNEAIETYRQEIITDEDLD